MILGKLGEPNFDQYNKQYNLIAKSVSAPNPTAYWSL